MAKKTTKKSEVKNEETYKVTLLMLGKKYISEASSLYEAISKLDPGIAKGRGIIVVEKGSFKKERILQPQIVFRLFNTAGFSKDVAIKNITNLFI